MIEAFLSPTANCRRVSLMLECCGVDYTVRVMDRDRKEHKTSDFLRLNPAGAVPVIVNADDVSGSPVVLAQSGAIMLYLAEMSGRFLPASGAQRWSVLQAFMQVMTDVNPTASVRFILNKSVQANAETTELIHRRLVNFLSYCDQMLARNRYLAGDMSIADIALYPVYKSHETVADETEGLVHLKKWAQAMGNDPVVAKGMAAI